jgi:hypothetical protein
MSTAPKAKSAIRPRIENMPSYGLQEQIVDYWQYAFACDRQKASQLAYQDQQIYYKDPTRSRMVFDSVTAMWKGRWTQVLGPSIGTIRTSYLKKHGKGVLYVKLQALGDLYYFQSELIAAIKVIFKCDDEEAKSKFKMARDPRRGFLRFDDVTQTWRLNKTPLPDPANFGPGSGERRKDEQIRKYGSMPHCKHKPFAEFDPAKSEVLQFIHSRNEGNSDEWVLAEYRRAMMSGAIVFDKDTGLTAGCLTAIKPIAIVSDDLWATDDVLGRIELLPPESYFIPDYLKSLNYLERDESDKFQKFVTSCQVKFLKTVRRSVPEIPKSLDDDTLLGMLRNWSTIEWDATDNKVTIAGSNYIKKDESEPKAAKPDLANTPATRSTPVEAVLTATAAVDASVEAEEPVEAVETVKQPKPYGWPDELTGGFSHQLIFDGMTMPSRADYIKRFNEFVRRFPEASFGDYTPESFVDMLITEKAIYAFEKRPFVPKHEPYETVSERHARERRELWHR